ncbi:MAG: winged helix-turn-helix domain-containing protein [Phycisphaeraceae bacterium]|nr:winged helix-turn-helix domain-containing protein [Phycisphaeraceae bacterium]
MSKAKPAPVADQPATPTPRPRRKARIEVPTKKERQPKRTTPAPASDAPREPKPGVRVRATPDKRLSALDAAAQVLAGLSGKVAADGLSAADLIERMATAKLWTSPGGKTPSATLSAAMAREIATKGTASRFRKVGPGRFAINTAPAARTAKPRDPAKRSAAAKPESGR